MMTAERTAGAGSLPIFQSDTSNGLLTRVEIKLRIDDAASRRLACDYHDIRVANHCFDRNKEKLVEKRHESVLCTRVA